MYRQLYFIIRRCVMSRSFWVLITLVAAFITTYYITLRSLQLFLNEQNGWFSTHPRKTVVYIQKKPSCLPDTRETIWMNNVWQTALNDKGEAIYIFGAYWDNRTSVRREQGVSTVVRLFTVSTYALQTDIYCQVRSHNQTLLEINVAAAEDNGRGLRVNKTFYQERMISCPVGPGAKAAAAFVSLSFQKCEQATNQLEIFRPHVQETYEIDIGICVPVSYGRLSPLALAEWIEYHRIAGIGEFNFYDSQVHSKTRAAMEVFQKTGIVHVRPSAPPVNNWCTWCQKLAVIPALQDCMYRNMFRYKYLLVIDADEYLVPKVHHSIVDMLATFPRSVEDPNKPRKYETSSYMFQNAYFFLDFNTSKKRNDNLLTSKYTMRAPVSKVGYASKSIINPRLCVIMQNHYCMVRTMDRLDVWMWPVPSKTAVIQHYKTCQFDQSKCKELLKQGKTDRNINRFANLLNERVQKVMQSFNNL